jgi:hypothetical protein
VTWTTDQAQPVGVVDTDRVSAPEPGDTPHCAQYTDRYFPVPTLSLEMEFHVKDSPETVGTATVVPVTEMATISKLPAPGVIDAVVYGDVLVVLPAAARLVIDSAISQSPSPQQSVVPNQPIRKVKA